VANSVSSFEAISNKVDYDDNTEYTDDDFEGDGDDEIDDDINDSYIDENSGEYYTDDQSSVGAANWYMPGLLES